MIQLFRVLLPSWRFFDGVREAPELFFRVISYQQEVGDWILCIPKIKGRRWQNLGVNAHENFLFASHALLEYLQDDLRDGSDPTVSLELVKNLVLYQIRMSGLVPHQMQFMVAQSPMENEAFYLSPVMGVFA